MLAYPSGGDLPCQAHSVKRWPEVMWALMKVFDNHWRA
jgi:hypothetical protein